jgi:hypothetical protein
MSGRDAVPNEAGKRDGKERAFAQAGHDTRHDQWILYGD